MELKSILPAMRVEDSQWKECEGINGTTFIIKPYQRGYRWEKDNVKKLLEDLSVYSNETSKDIITFWDQNCQEKEEDKKEKAEKYDFYCLQALSVKIINDKNEKEFELIDGQQRVTTVFLIYELLNAFCDFAYFPKNPPYDIVYKRGGTEKDEDNVYYLSTKLHNIIKDLKIDETSPTDKYREGRARRIEDESNWFGRYKEELKGRIRERESLDSESESNSLTLDLFYLSEAAEEIIEFIRNFSDEVKPSEISKYFDIIKQNVLFLWYEVDNNINAEEEFKSLNTNKVRLTNAELIKALVLRREGNADAGHRWEAIEQGLCKNELWAFISGEDKATRIDLILELFARGVNQEDNGFPDKYESDPNNEYKLFDWYEELMQTKREFSTVVLQSIEKIYDRICEWYDDVDIYHLIGLLTCFNRLKLKGETKRQEEIVKQIFDLYNDSKHRNDFISKLKEEIRQKIASGLDKENKNTIDDIIDAYSYDDEKDRPYIFAILWALNAWETMEAAENNVPAKDKKNDKRKERVPVILKRMPFSKINGKLSKDDSWSLEHIMPQNPDESESDDIKKGYIDFINNIKSSVEIIKDEDNIHSIGNMALLTHSSNSELKNKNLQLKREHIVQLIGKGKYVPCATINAFNLFYNMQNETTNDSESSNATDNEYKVGEIDYKYWTISDRDKYLERIKECLKDYGFKDNEADSAEYSEEETK